MTDEAPAMRVGDVMTHHLVTLSPEMPIQEIAAVLSEHGISGAPVVAQDGALLGVVTESDLAHRIAARAAKPPSWVKTLFSPPRREALDYARTHGRTARDIMTAPAHSVTEETTVEEAAWLLEKAGIRRLPVLRAGRVVGVVSRADLLRALYTPEKPGPVSVDDRELGADLLRALHEATWSYGRRVHFTVRDGVITFYGYGGPSEMQRALRVLAEGLAGVRGVEFPAESATP